MMGLTPTQVVEAFAPLGVAAIGANCGKSLDDTDLIVDELLAAAGGLPLWVKPNAGVPRMVGDEVVYDAGPDDLAAHVAGYVDARRADRRRLLRLDARSTSPRSRPRFVAHSSSSRS